MHLRFRRLRQLWCLLQGRLRWDCLGFLAHKTFDHPMSREPAYASMLGDTLLSVLNETSHNSKNKETFQIEGLIQLKRISNSLKRCQNYLCLSHSKLSFPSQADVVPSPMKFFLRFCSKRCSKSIYFSREIIGNHGGWHPSFARNTNRFMGCICTWVYIVYMTLKPWSLLGQRSQAKFQIS